MTTRFRVTKVICPICHGSGNGSLFRIPCGLCWGEKRVGVRVARSYADNLYTIAVGGYVCGDHEIKDRDRMTDEAMAVFKLLGETPPWLRSTGCKWRAG